MKVTILDTYYPRFLDRVYARQSTLARSPSEAQCKVLLSQFFGTGDFYSRHLRELGWQADDLVVNATPLQTAWANEQGVSYSRLALAVPQRLLRLPVIGPWLSSLPGLVEIAVAQIIAHKPDVLYCQDLWFLPPAVMARLRPHVGLIVGQIASPLPPLAYLRSFDLITTSFPHLVPRLRAMGIASEYFRIAFDPSVLTSLGNVPKDVDVSFVGGISRHHGKALPMLEYLAEHTPMEFFGYGAGGLPASSPIRRKHRGEVWGLDMYRALARSRITLNRHINVAENNANNMRLYEATGVGTLLITDHKDNLGELFEVGREVVSYTSPEDAAEKIRYYLAHPDEAAAIARAGQARTLREHTYRDRMVELNGILKNHLQKGRA